MQPNFHIGEYSLSLKKKGYRDYNANIKIEEGENKPIKCKLKK